MTSTTSRQSQLKRSAFGIVSFAVVLGVVAALIWIIPSSSPPTSQRTKAPQQSKADIDRSAREEAWRRAVPRMEQANVEMEKLSQELCDAIEAFFTERKQSARVNAFAEAAFSWKSTWEAIKSREGHLEFLSDKFEEHIFKKAELEAQLENCTAEYCQGLAAVENRLLVDIRADIADILPLAIPAIESQALFEQEMQRQIETSQADLPKDVAIDVVLIGHGLKQLVRTGPVENAIVKVLVRSIQATATRLGVSASVLSTGAASSWATVGASVVVAILVERLIDGIIRWFHNPEADLAQKVTEGLSDLQRSIMDGDQNAWAYYERIKKIAESHPDVDTREKAIDAIPKFEDLPRGLKFEIDQVSKSRNEARTAILKKLILGDHS